MKWATDKANIVAAQGGCSYGDMSIKCPQGLFCWITDLYMRVKPVVLE